MADQPLAALSVAQSCSAGRAFSLHSALLSMLRRVGWLRLDFQSSAASMRPQYNPAMFELKRQKRAPGIACLVLWPILAQGPVDTRQLTLGFHMVVSCDSSLASAPMHLGGGPKQYCLERSAIIDQTDVASAAFAKNVKDDRPVITLPLPDAAGERLREITATKIGLQIGALLNGRLVSVASIMGPTRTPSIHGLTQQEGTAIIQAFRRGAVARTPPPSLPSGNTHSPQPDSQGVYRVGNGVSAPVLIRKANPEYMERARADNIEGTVVLEAVIRPDGTPDVTRILRSLAPDLDAKAMECVRGWRFRPAFRDQEPVAVRTTLEISFRLERGE